MKLSWLNICFCLSFFLLALLRTKEVQSLQRSFSYSKKSLRLDHFSKARQTQTMTMQEDSLMRLWESLVSGRLRIVPKLIKEKYSLMAVNHLFTPSGFHLSALLFPFYFFIKNKKYLFSLLLSVFILLNLYAPGLNALKRMSMVKMGNLVLGRKAGFIGGMILDVLFGSFNQGPLGFTYSFLFLSLIYSQTKGFKLLLSFFAAQFLIAYFQQKSISPLLIFFSPIINGLFSLILPFLFLLSYPLWTWQISLGLLLLKTAQLLIQLSCDVITFFPLIETNIVSLVILVMFFKRKFFLALPLILFFSSELNTPIKKISFLSRYDVNTFHPLFKHEEKTSNPPKKKANLGNCQLTTYLGHYVEKCRLKKKKASRRKPSST